MAGHVESRTYRNNYQDQRITDVAGLGRGQATKDTFIRKLDHIGINVDPGVNATLALEAPERIASLPDDVALRLQHLSLVKAV